MDLVIIFGPPAVGKMTVGHALSGMTGMPLLFNHLTIDPVLRFFPFGSPPYTRLVGEFRTRIAEEVAASDLPGLIFTFAWDLDDPADKAFIDRFAGIFTGRGAGVHFAELYAPQEVRLVRNTGEFRLANKAPKRDLVHSRANLLEADRRCRLNSDGAFFYPDRHLRLDNSGLPPEAAAQCIADRFALARRPSP